MNSSYIAAVASYIPKFGDIITLARGRLEKFGNKNEYRFIEGQCDNNSNCDPKYVIAYWQVQKIRHRDIDRNFRYEIKFSINPRVNINNNETNGKREISINNSRSPRQSHTLKSFILKDDDYPKSFTYLDEHIAQRRYDNENRNIYLEKLSAFNEVFTQPRYFDINRNLGEVYHHNQNNNLPDLNIGEYVIPNRKIFLQQPESLSRTSIYNNNLPTTYRPNYHLKFTKPYSNLNPYYNNHNQPSELHYPEHNIHNNEPILPISLNENTEKEYPITTHLHHHFYLKNNQADRPKLHKNYEQQEQILKTEIAYQQNYHQDTIDLIQQPLTTLSAPKQQNFYTSPSTILNQIPIPPQLQQHQRQPPQSHEQYIYNDNNNNRGTNPILPSPPLFYMHPIPISSQLPLYLFPNTNQHNDDNQKSETPPFRESHRIVNQLQYSEPDPLYQNNREYKANQRNTNNYFQVDTTQNYENIVNTDFNKFNFDVGENSQQNNDDNNTKPDSINAQLPPPNDDEDLTVPYVDNSSATESSSESSSQLFVQKQIEQSTGQTFITPVSTLTTTAPTTFLPTKIYPTLKRSNKFQISNTTKSIQLMSELSPTISVTDKTINAKNLVRISTTLQPKLNNVNNFMSTVRVNTESSALKYLKPTITTFKLKQIIQQSTVKPKIIGNDKSLITTTKKIYHRSTTERPVLKWKPKRAKITKELKPILPTKSTISKFEFERVPVNVTERVFTVTPSKINNDISTKKSVSKSISIKVGKEDKERPFSLKVKIPNVEVYEADLIKVNTTDKGIKFFKAFSAKDETEKTKQNVLEEAELTQSIVEHVRSL